MRTARKGKFSLASFDVRSARVTELPQVESQAIFCVAGPMEALLEQRLDFALRGRASDRGHAGVPTGGDVDVLRQAGGIGEALGVRNRPLVKWRDALRKRVDETVEFAVR